MPRVEEESNSSESEGEEFEVERILETRIGKAGREYFVKWKGYGNDANSWEPEENMEGCPDALADFWKRQNKKKEENRLEKAKKEAKAKRKYAGAMSRGSSITSTSSSIKVPLPSPASSTQKTTRKSVPPPVPVRLAESSSGEEEEEESASEVEEESKKAKRDVVGFDKGFKAEAILGATNEFGELMFLVKWQGVVEADLLPAAECNVKIPDLVIDFYEERLTWDTPESLLAQMRANESSS